jgi:formylglycine-generating enzyme required for sulfatase activity
VPATELTPLIRLELPYPGLRPFEVDEAFLFYGRKSHTEELLNRLATSRFLAVVGTSGSGKSSLVRAGLLPALYRGFLAGGTSKWRIAVMKPGDAPMTNLARALEEQHVSAPELSRSSLGLARAASESAFAPGEGLLIVVDQFEELFRFRQEQTDGGAEANLFVTSLLEASDSFSAPVYVVVTMRSDFLGDCTQFPALAEALNRSQYLVPRLTREQRREAIEKPVRLVDAAMAPRLVQRLLHELGDDPDQLPVLQHALNRTFRKWKESGAVGDIDFAHYEAARTLEGALNDHADTMLSELSAAGRDCAGKLFRCLTTTEAGGRAVRRAARLERIYEVLGIREGDVDSRALVCQVIAKFAHRDNSLLVFSPPGELKPDSVIDISHESLIARWSKLKKWVDEEADAVRWYASAAEDALRHRRGEAGTWRDPELGRVLALAEKGPWNDAWARRKLPDQGIAYPDVRAFLDRGAADQRAERRRARAWWMGAVAMLTVALVSVAGLALERGREIQAKERLIESQNQIRDLNGLVLAKEDERGRLEAQLKQANLSEAQRSELQRKVDAVTGDLKAIEERRLQAEQKAQAGETQAKGAVSETAAASRQISALEADLRKAQEERDAFKRQLEAVLPAETKATPSEHPKAPARTSQVNEEAKKAEAPPEGAVPALVAGQTRTGNDGLTYVWIPPGKFMMGCSPGDKSCIKVDEAPQHPVVLTSGFWLGETEVTEAAYGRFQKTGSGDSNLPQAGVSWEDAKGYCQWAGLRLPTEAEWEYAARAGATGARYGKLDEIAWYKGNSAGQPHPVRLKQPNAWGLYDMLGNVSEWVADGHDYTYYERLKVASDTSRQGATVDPTGPLHTKNRVLRGGSVKSYECRLSARDHDKPISRRPDAGFRCAADR